MKSFIINAVNFLLVSLLLTGCYKEQHFDFPGPYEDTTIRRADSLPFPFDKSRNAGVWLMKNGIPENDKILFKGYTDFYAAGDTISWEKQTNGYRLIPHRNFYPVSDKDHFGGNPNSYRNNWVYSKYFVPVGPGKSFYMYTKFTLGTFSGTAAGFLLGKSWETGGEFIFGFDGFSNIAPTFFVDLYGRQGVSVNPDLGWPTVNEVIVPGVPADFEIVIHDGLFYILVNGTLCFQFKLPNEQTYYFTPVIRPWRNFITVHDFYIESNDMYTVDFAMHENEENYNRIQAPALAKAANGNLLLFAEGRSLPTFAGERIAQNTIPVGNCDIIMKRSTDGGISWSDQISVIAGQNSSETFAFPQVVSTDNGKIILHYSSIPSTLVNNNYVYNQSAQKVYQMVSTDNGNSWSPPVEITTSLKDNAGYFRSGPGHGIELTSAVYNKRLVMPVVYGGNVIKVAYSDDEGVSWKVSNAVPGSNLRFGSIVELSDTRLMMVLTHSGSTPRNKLVSHSIDGGKTWSSATNIGAGVSTLDYGHMYQGVTVKDLSGKIHLINPTGRESDPDTYNSPVFAVTPYLFTSQNGGATFDNSSRLFTKTAYHSYSSPIGFLDAVALDDGTIIIVGEGGVESPREGIVVYRKKP